MRLREIFLMSRPPLLCKEGNTPQNRKLVNAFFRRLHAAEYTCAKKTERNLTLMKKILLILAAVLSARISRGQSPVILPFSIEASEDVVNDFPGAPRLQSFSFAQWKGCWVFIGGRVSGYHAVGGGSAEFLRADANSDVWVIDTTVKPAKTYHVSVDQLPVRLGVVGAQWAST